eukprot:TRINITY_DN40459_c0_g1_i1.p1 TRINITY_DN40459_c0_g1~~TRINITY_DN40459_c0_g1_i1.p1  ORF type:complete len:253 (+),score=60.39 TRINITY_DN40459_c0_g1_i1:51-809(+)
MGGCGLPLFVIVHGERYPIDVDPDAKVADVEAELTRMCGPTHWRLTFAGKPLQSSELLSDTGVSAEAELRHEGRGLHFDTNLPHGALQYNEDCTKAWGNFQQTTITTMCSVPAANPGVTTFGVRVSEYKDGGNYFGVGFHPQHPHPQQLVSQRIASDSTTSQFQGMGFSLNQNGCVYGCVTERSGGSAGTVRLGDEIWVTMTMPKGTVLFEVRRRGAAGHVSECAVTDKHDRWFPAVFFQYGDGTVLELLEP